MSLNAERSLMNKLTTLFVVGTLLFSNVLTVYGGEKAFWTLRRRSVEQLRQGQSQGRELRSSNQGTSSLSQDAQRTLLAQLPQPGGGPLGSPWDSPLPMGLPQYQSNSSQSKHGLPGDTAQSQWAPFLLPYGTVRESFTAKRPNAPFIIHIQDAHGIFEAQQNIAAMIQGLADIQGVTLVGMEGASGPFTTDRYRHYPDPHITAGLVESYLKESLLSGPEYAAIVSSKDVTLWGVENPDIYRENIKAFKDSLKTKRLLAHWLERAGQEVERRKDVLFSPPLKDYDRHVTAYHSRQEEIGPYARFLYQQAKRLQINGMKIPQVDLFVEAMTQEGALDFKAVERGRRGLAQALADRVSKTDLESLAQKSLLCRMGRVTLGEFNRSIQEMCFRYQIPLKNYGPLEDYLRYVSLAERIHPEGLLAELTTLEKTVGDVLAETAEQKDVMATNRSLLLLSKLANQTLPPAEWDAYRIEKTSILASVKSMLGGIDESILEPAERFCRLATERNGPMADHLLAQMKATGRSSAVLVAGGFHSDGLTQMFRSKDVSYVVVTPKITKTPDENNYLDIFSNDPLPLEKLFSGEEIALVAPPPTAGSTKGPRGFMVPGSFILGHSALQDMVPLFATGDPPITVEALFKDVKDNAGKLFSIRMEELKKDRLSRAGLFTLLKAKMIQNGTMVHCQIFASPIEKWEGLQPLLEEQGWGDHVVKRSEISIEGKTYVLVLMGLQGEDTPSHGPAATFYWLGGEWDVLN
ncbi:MAG: hypothetical protein JNK54_10605 [Elusimicrobia bacterium]|nr:hypothetical protein [Elusimicrobiota bacterium]